MNEDYRGKCTHVLFDLSVARQTEFDAAAREYRDKKAAWAAEERRLLDKMHGVVRSLDKIAEQLLGMGCAAPDVIEEEGSLWAMQAAQKEKNAGNERLN